MWTVKDCLTAEANGFSGRKKKLAVWRKHVWSFWNFKELKWEAAGNKITCWDECWTRLNCSYLLIWGFWSNNHIDRKKWRKPIHPPSKHSLQRSTVAVGLRRHTAFYFATLALNIFVLTCSEKSQLSSQLLMLCDDEKWSQSRMEMRKVKFLAWD